MNGDVDLFAVYRWMLAVFCGLYALFRTVQVVAGWLAYFASSPRARILGRYVTVQLMRLSLRRFSIELAQIAVLAALLGVLVFWHH